MPAGEPVEVQFNKNLDYAQIRDHGDDLFEVTLDGAKVAGYVSLTTNNDGSRLVFRPSSAFIDGKRYRVILSGAISDIHGQRLENDYSFRFVSSSDEQPVIRDVIPGFASWRGGKDIVIYGDNFSNDTRIILGGITVDSSVISIVNEHEMRFILPALSSSPADNLLMGIEVENGQLLESRRAAFTYIADPLIESIGYFTPYSGEFDDLLQTFLFNSGEYAAITGVGFSPLTEMTVNGKPAVDVVLQSPNLISFL